MNQKCSVKLLNIKKNHQTSLQLHHNRDEIHIVLKGKFLMTHGDESFVADEGSTFRVMREQKHRMKGLANNNQILEVSLGEFTEDDIVRIEDDYNRANDHLIQPLRSIKQ